MDEVLITRKTFDRQDFTQRALPAGEYEDCIFNHCDLSNTDLSGIHFSECTFTGCNLSMATLKRTVFREVKFEDCKMLGLRFDNCDQFIFSISTERCILNYSVFYQTKLKKTIFRNNSMVETDFSQCDLTNATFDNCELAGATFDNTILEKADFRTSFNYSIDPDKNKIKKARFSRSGIVGLLDKYDIEIDPHQ